MPEEPGLADVIAEQQELLSRLRAVVEAKDAENAVLRRELDAERELRGQLELRLAELERRLSMDSSDSGTPSSRERIGAKEARRARQQSERERSKDRKRGGQPGHQGKGLQRDPDPGESKTADPPAADQLLAGVGCRGGHGVADDRPPVLPQDDPAESCYQVLLALAVPPGRKAGPHTTVAVHQVTGLRELGKPGPGQPAWAALMAKMRRKTLIVCAPCHDWIHANPVAHAA